jgi:hypothetical protein
MGEGHFEILGRALKAGDYPLFQEREAARALRIYRLKLGLLRAFLRRPKWMHIATAWRLLTRTSHSKRS